MTPSRPAQDVARRVRPLLDRLATRSLDKARLLQYLSAMAGLDWGVFRLRDRYMEGGVETLVLEDRASAPEYRIEYPGCLPRDLDPLVRAEYRRLALARPLTVMDRRLFDHFFADSHCARCRWAGPQHAQVHLECHFAGHPVNYEPAP